MRNVVTVAFPTVQSLDITGPLEVFATANQLAGKELYSNLLIAPVAGPVASSSGVRLLAEAGLEEARGTIHTLLVAGGEGARQALARPEWMTRIVQLAERADRVAAVCTGAFVLASAGLLKGRRAVTHWNYCRLLAEKFPAVRVEEDAIFVQDGKFFTSAGVTAGIDLALALLESDHGGEAALEVARQLVVFLKRPGGQSQYSSHLTQLTHHMFSALLQWMATHPGADLSVEALAERASMSPRHFARRFAQNIGLSPGEYVQRLRIEEARRCLSETDWPVSEVARRCGFHTPETLRQAFQRRLKVSPQQFRERFQINQEVHHDAFRSAPFP